MDHRHELFARPLFWDYGVGVRVRTRSFSLKRLAILAELATNLKAFRSQLPSGLLTFIDNDAADVIPSSIFMQGRPL